ncbi:MAG: hypothetical protein JXR37_31535 [Kiritimatiellae bacterium]|nr:hypothetical protein [Kiritimatiellia bacterium]
MRGLAAVDRSLVIRNWLLGMYIVEFEQHGSDRAKYGDRLLKQLAHRMSAIRRRGFSVTNLKLFRQFYQTYAGIGQTLPDQSIRGQATVEMRQTLSALLQDPEAQASAIGQTLSDQFAQRLPLSWSHYASGKSRGAPTTINKLKRRKTSRPVGKNRIMEPLMGSRTVCLTQFRPARCGLHPGIAWSPRFTQFHRNSARNRAASGETWDE